MKSTRPRVLAHTLLASAALGLAATNAHAVSATWELKGTITVSQFATGPDQPNIPVGTPFRMLVTFDTEEEFGTRNSTVDPDTGLPRPGIRYQYFGASSLRLVLYAGPDCNPCTPANIPARNGIFVRDNFADLDRNPEPNVAYDGYSFYMDPDPADDNYEWQVIFREQSSILDLVDVTGSPLRPLPAVPDARLTQMSESVFNISNERSGGEDWLSGRIETVSSPTYGTAYVLTGRDCSYPDFVGSGWPPPTPAEVYDDCFSQGRGGAYNRFLEEGGGAGQGDFSRTLSIEFPSYSTTFPAPLNSLGAVFGAATFGGPSALPVAKASSYPTDIARTNGNVQAYQQYKYRGAVRTDMPLVADLTYQIRDNLVMPANPNPNVPDTSIYPGVGRVGATLAIVDGEKVSTADMAAAGFGHRTCGSEQDRDPFTGNLIVTRTDGSAWPAGSIMGTATYQSSAGESGAQARLIDVVRCALPGEAANADGTVASGSSVSLAPMQVFYVVTTLQTPARGRWQQAVNTASPPPQNGYADASSTLRVTIDPQAPAEVVQQFVQYLGPTCIDCEFPATERILRIDVKPGSSDNSIQPGSSGSLPVAIFGSIGLPVEWIDIASLRLGELQLKANKLGKPQCSFGDLDLDGLDDLMCHFQNEIANWQSGQTTVSLTGVLNNTEPVVGGDSVRILN